MAKVFEGVIDVFRNFRVVDAVDIFLVALVVMRQTRAISLIKGVGVVLLAILITTWFPTFNWLVSRLILPGTIAAAAS